MCFSFISVSLRIHIRVFANKKCFIDSRCASGSYLVTHYSSYSFKITFFFSSVDKSLLRFLLKNRESGVSPRFSPTWTRCLAPHIPFLSTWLPNTDGRVYSKSTAFAVSWVMGISFMSAFSPTKLTGINKFRNALFHNKTACGRG